MPREASLPRLPALSLSSSVPPVAITLECNTSLKKTLRNHALDEYNATRKLLKSSVPITQVTVDESLARPLLTASSQATDPQLLESWLFHSTNVDSKQIPVSSIKEVNLLKNGSKLKLKLNNQLVMTLKSKSKSRPSCILKPWFIKLNKSPYVDNESEDSTVAGVSTEQNTGVFNNVQFAIDFGKLSSKDKEDLQNLIKANRGQISYIITKNTNYFVCGTQKDFYKCQRAARLGIPIVSKEFIHQCVKKGKLIPPPRSDEDLKASLDDFAKGKIHFSNGEKTDDGTEEFCLDTLKKYKLDDAEFPDFTEEYHVAKFAFFLNKETNSIVCVEAHVATDSLDHTENLHRVMISIRFSVEKTRRFFYFVDDAYRLCQCYEAVVRSHENDGWTRQLDVMKLDNITDLPSEKLINLLEEMKIFKGSLHPDVERLVASIWNDSLGELAKCDIVLENLTVHDVCNAMITLLKIEQALKNKSELFELTKEFHKHVHRKKMRVIDSIQAVAKERDICQVLKNVVCMKENLWNVTNVEPCILQYSALNCVIRPVDQAHAEFKSILDLLPSKNEMNYDIINIFRITRTVEDVEFYADIENRKLLFHSSSPSNIVSILSRGLVMPSKASDELGIPRTDEGNLGNGIYFSDSFALSSKYTSVSASRGSRIMLVHEVALGDVYETNKHMSHLMTPPNGFHSVKGINLDEDSKGDEFAIYNVNQQRIRYLIEFILEREAIHTNPNLGHLSIFKSPMNIPEDKSPESFSEPILKAVEFGLVSSAKNFVSLEEYHVRGKIVDLVAEVTVFQIYRNYFRSQIEGKYVFPLEENVAVCGFEAYINEKHVIGVVKEKEKARQEYRKAVAEGHGAYLMEEEEPSIFSLSLGNIPAYAKIVIKIKYVCELETINDPDSCVLFTLPKNLSGWRQDSTLMKGLPTQGSTNLGIVTHNTKKTSFMVSIDMPYEILEVKSPTHVISWKKTSTKACVKLAKSASLLKKNLRLFIRVAEIHVPRIWVEQYDEVSSSEVAMVTFFPEFDFDACNDYQCTILLDMSRSMNGKPCSYAKYISESIIKALPEKCKFNVIIFGSYYKDVFVTHQHASDSIKHKALEIVGTSQPNFGGSDLIHILSSQYLLLRGAETCSLHNVFLISDGHVDDEERVLRLATKISTASSSQTRFFSYAVGDTPNCHFLRKICTISGGRFELFLPAVKHTWAGQMENQMRCAMQPVLTDVHIEWCNYETENNDISIFTNIPEKPKCLFSGSRMTAYSFLPNCSKATLHARILGAEVSTVVTVNSLSKITGKTLHYLAAKAVFEEYETGNLADNTFVNQIYRDQQKSFITSLSIKHSVVCKFTSFIAVEKRDDNEDMTIMSGPTTEELLKSSFNDEIPEVAWEGIELSVQDKIDELLKHSKQYETSSILQARELAQRAANLFEDLPFEPLKLLLVSAPCFRLGIPFYCANPRKMLDSLLLQGDSLNFEIINEISRCKDSSYSTALEELTSLSWPPEDSVRLRSIPSLFRPIFISAFHSVFQDQTSFFVDDIRTTFWDSMRDIDMKQDYNTVSTLLKLRLRRLSTLRMRNRDVYISKRLCANYANQSTVEDRGTLYTKPTTHGRSMQSRPQVRTFARIGRKPNKYLSTYDSISPLIQSQARIVPPLPPPPRSALYSSLRHGQLNQKLPFHQSYSPASLNPLQTPPALSAGPLTIPSPVRDEPHQHEEYQGDSVRSQEMSYDDGFYLESMAPGELMGIDDDQDPVIPQSRIKRPVRKAKRSAACYTTGAGKVAVPTKIINSQKRIGASNLASDIMMSSVSREFSGMSATSEDTDGDDNLLEEYVWSQTSSLTAVNTGATKKVVSSPTNHHLIEYTASPELGETGNLPLNESGPSAMHCADIKQATSCCSKNRVVSAADIQTYSSYSGQAQRFSLPVCGQDSFNSPADPLKSLETTMFGVSANLPGSSQGRTQMQGNVDLLPFSFGSTAELRPSSMQSKSRDNVMFGGGSFGGNDLLQAIESESISYEPTAPHSKRLDSWLHRETRSHIPFDHPQLKSDELTGGTLFGFVAERSRAADETSPRISERSWSDEEEEYYEEGFALADDCLDSADSSVSRSPYDIMGFPTDDEDIDDPVDRLVTELLVNGFNASKFQHIADLTCQRRSFSPDDAELQEISYCSTERLIMTTIEKVVYEAGGKSLGVQCFNECLQLLFLNVMIVLCDHIAKEVNGDGMEEVLETLKSWVKLSDEKYPLLYHRLELGTSWTNAAHSIIDSVCKNFP